LAISLNGQSAVGTLRMYILLVMPDLGLVWQLRNGPFVVG